MVLIPVNAQMPRRYRIIVRSLKQMAGIAKEMRETALQVKANPMVRIAHQEKVVNGLSWIKLIEDTLHHSLESLQKIGALSQREISLTKELRQEFEKTYEQEKNILHTHVGEEKGHHRWKKSLSDSDYNKERFEVQIKRIIEDEERGLNTEASTKNALIAHANLFNRIDHALYFVLGYNSDLQLAIGTFYTMANQEEFKDAVRHLVREGKSDQAALKRFLNQELELFRDIEIQNVALARKATAAKSYLTRQKYKILREEADIENLEDESEDIVKKNKEYLAALNIDTDTRNIEALEQAEARYSFKETKRVLRKLKKLQRRERR